MTTQPTASFVTRTGLNRETKKIMEEMAKSGAPVVVMYRGRPEAIIQPIDEDKMAGLIVETATDLVAERQEAYLALDEGKALSSDDLFGDQKG